MLNRLSPARFDVNVICAPAGVAKLRALNDTIALLQIPHGMKATIEAIRSARIDLLYYWEIGVDSLSYFSAVFSFSPRAIFASWGWPVTSGISAMDYFLSSELLEPPDADYHYSEQLIRLRNIPNFYPRPQWNPPLADRARFGIAADRHVYACGSKSTKNSARFRCVGRRDSAARSARRIADDRSAMASDHGGNSQPLRPPIPRLRRSLAIRSPHEIRRLSHTARHSWTSCSIRYTIAAGRIRPTTRWRSGAPVGSRSPSELHRGRYTAGRVPPNGNARLRRELGGGVC